MNKYLINKDDVFGLNYLISFNKKYPFFREFNFTYDAMNGLGYFVSENITIIFGQTYDDNLLRVSINRSKTDESIVSDIVIPTLLDIDSLFKALVPFMTTKY